MKKMRRMIPALCMLLVSAIMLSTASYAWFTMNEAVTATGMQVQAQAGGSLIIGKGLLDADDRDWSVDFAEEGTTKIGPMTWINNAFQVPADTTAIDGKTGGYDGDWTTNNAYVEDQTYIEYEVYIAVSGDKLTARTINATLTTDSSLDIANAYAVAFYVNKAEITGSTQPDLTLHVINGKTFGTETSKNTGALYTGDIPSTVGAAADSVGIKVVMRVYVDGNLKTGDKMDVMVPNYVSQLGEQYDPTQTYYTKEGNTYTPAATENVYGEGDKIELDWYILDGEVKDGEADLYYVRNNTAPEAPSGLNVKFELAE